MSQLSLGTKLAIINTLTAANVAFIVQNAAGTNPLQTRLTPTVSNAALATDVFISGHGQYNLASIRYFRAVKPVNGQVQRIAVDAADPTQITVATGLVKGDQIVFKLEATTSDARSEFASNDTRETRYQPPFTYICKGNDTALQVLTGLYNQINSVKNLFPEADGAGEPYTATFAAGVLTIEAKDCHLQLRLYVDDIFKDNADQVPVFKPVITQEQFEGRGTFVQMRAQFHETPGSNELDASSKRTNLPIEGGLYTSLLFGTRTDRPDLSGNGAASQEVFQRPDFNFYVPETAANDSVLDALLTFFNRSTGTKEFIKGDVAGTAGVLADLVGAAIPVYDAGSEE